MDCAERASLPRHRYQRTADNDKDRQEPQLTTPHHPPPSHKGTGSPGYSLSRPCLQAFAERRGALGQASAHDRGTISTDPMYALGLEET
jgi:hypothetical protein